MNAHVFIEPASNGYILTLVMNGVIHEKRVESSIKQAANAMTELLQKIKDQAV